MKIAEMEKVFGGMSDEDAGKLIAALGVVCSLLVFTNPDPGKFLYWQRNDRPPKKCHSCSANRYTPKVL